ncbi:MAG: hypothetical protein Q9M13_09040 [Mariprofundales bacterium]|nr:hypothetical protein [Mariprofundales bacterium]
MNSIRWVSLIMALLLTTPAEALDSYRFLHVTIETPWIIFIFLFFLVFAPMILMATLYWRYALSKKSVEDEADEQE